MKASRIGLAGLTVVALIAVALYAAFLASKVEDVITPEPIVLPEGAAPSALGLGQRAPDFALQDLRGSEVKLSDLAGRPVWVNVWASWCAPCRAEMPDLDTVYREMRTSGEGSSGSGADNGLALLMISIDPDPSAVRTYLSTVKYNLPVLLDPSISISRNYRITGLPTHFFIGRDGKIKDLAIGGLKPSGMRSRLAKILS
jgi:cytochrome c biogenesis protein CcmG, thiol:disulfide interchange protein DsbE